MTKPLHRGWATLSSETSLHILHVHGSLASPVFSAHCSYSTADVDKSAVCVSSLLWSHVRYPCPPGCTDNDYDYRSGIHRKGKVAAVLLLGGLPTSEIPRKQFFNVNCYHREIWCHRSGKPWPGKIFLCTRFLLIVVEGQIGVRASGVP